MATCDDKELISNFDRRMESSGARFWAAGLNSDFLPGEGFEVEGPNIVHVGHTLTTENDEVRIKEFSSMVGSFPGGLFVLLWNDLSPLLGVPIEQMNGIESFFIWGAAAVKNDSVIFLIVGDGAV